MNLASARINAGLSQSEVARRIGVDQSSVSCWEAGKRMPRAIMLVKMAELYRCTIDELLGRSVDQNSA